MKKASREEKEKDVVPTLHRLRYISDDIFR
jgi:hypothetical protein